MGIIMRCEDWNQQAMFSYISSEARGPEVHPLRPIRIMIDNTLVNLAPSFNEMYSPTGRPSILPEQFLGLCYWQYSTPSAVSGWRMSSWITICCFAGLSAHLWTTRLGITRPSPWSGIAWLLMKSQRGFSRLSGSRQNLPICRQTNTFMSTALWLRYGLHWRAFVRKMVRVKTQQHLVDAMRESTTDLDTGLYRNGKGKEARLCYVGGLLTLAHLSLCVASSRISYDLPCVGAPWCHPKCLNANWRDSLT